MLGINFFLNNKIFFNINIYSFLAFYLNIDMIEDLISNVIIFFLGKNPPYVINIFLELVSIPFVFWFCLMKERIDNKFLKLVFVYFSLCIVSYFLTPEIFLILKTNVIRGIFSIVIVVCLFSLLPSFTVLFSYLKPYIWVGLFYCLTRILVFDNPLLEEEIYQAFTYKSMIPMLTALTLVAFQEENRFGLLWNKCYSLCAFLLMFLVNVLCGARGAILCVAIALLLIFCFQDNKKKILWIVLLFLIGSLCFVHYETILNNVLQLFPGSRTLQRMAGEYIINTTTSVRSIMYNLLLTNFLEHPLTINGFFSDRVFLAQHFPVDSTVGIYGTYAHNFVLEVLYQFGIFGIPFILWFFWRTLNLTFILSRCDNPSLRGIFIISTAFCFGQLMFSSSYLVARSFGFFLSILLYVRVCERESIKYDKGIARS